jgi:hypothetical protein
MQSRRTGKNPGLRKIFGPGVEASVLPLAAIKHRAQRQLSKFDQEVRVELDQRGIAVPPGIGLLSCPQCSLKVEGEHPQLEAIRQWLDGNSKIANHYKEVEVLFEMVRAAESPGELFSSDSCFHIGLTRAGPVAYFEEHVCRPLEQG